eukprot:Skav217597  [mRNA]  locus=scaffold3512:207335:207829:+ [translate_table: standard]
MQEMMKSKLRAAASISSWLSDTKNPVAPSWNAKSFLAALRAITMVSAPIFAANCTAKCPRPPGPMIPTFLPFKFWVLPENSFRGVKVVTPAQSNGAASAGSKPAGIFNTFEAGVRM